MIGLEEIAPARRTYKIPAGSTTTTQTYGELPDFESLSMGSAPSECPVTSFPVLFVVYERKLDSPEIRSSLQTLIVQEQTEPDYSRIWRGVFSPLYHPNRLFSFLFEARTADLPRWKPRITIDRQRLSRGEDE